MQRILGFSGLDRAAKFKREHLPGLTSPEYAIFQGADAAAALVVNGRIEAAAAEERFNGRKHSASFPGLAAAYCLGVGGFGAADLDYVAHSFDYGPDREFYGDLSAYYRALYEEVLSPSVNQKVAEEALGVDLSGRFMPVRHHLAHASGSFYPSGFDESLVLVTDGLGERFSASIFIANESGFKTVLQIPAHDSVGLLYGLFTMYLGFRFGDGEYKVMGLAPLGDRNRHYRTIMERIVRLDENGRYHVPLLLANVTDVDKETYRPALAELERLFGARRAPGEPIEQRHKDIAAGLQAALQAVQMHLLRHARVVTGLDRLCISGGVGLNCVANGVIVRSGLFNEVYVQPTAGDDGTSLGAALYVTRELGGTPRPRRGTLLGPAYTTEECGRALDGVDGLDVEEIGDTEKLVTAVAAMLDDGLILGWFQNRMEFGPRALGNRSILADPRRAEMRDRINALVKKRESFRPFAPAVAVESAHELFEIDAGDAACFAEMLFVAYVRPEHAPRMPATTHVDGSARVQAVSPADNSLFWRLIRAFEERTALPVLLNTSFNVAGQPIVRTPREAVDTFLAAGLDGLVMQNLIIRRREERRDSA